MRKLRRCLAVALAFISGAFMLAGCKMPSEITDFIAAEAPIATATNVPTPSPSPTPEPTPEIIPEYIAGKVEGREYRSEYFRFGCELDDMWEIATPEELDKMSSVTVDMLQGSDLSEAYQNRIDDGKIGVEFYAWANNGLQNIAITSENDTDLFADDADLDLYTLLQAARLPLLETLAAAGIVVEDSDLTEVTIGETEQAAMTIHGDSSGVSVDILAVVIRRGAYFAFIRITTFGGDTTVELLKNFYMIQ